VVIETMDPSLATVYCPNLLLSNFTTFMGKKGVFGSFWQSDDHDGGTF